MPKAGYLSLTFRVVNDVSQCAPGIVERRCRCPCTPDSVGGVFWIADRKHDDSINICLSAWIKNAPGEPREIQEAVS